MIRFDFFFAMLFQDGRWLKLARSSLAMGMLASQSKARCISCLMLNSNGKRQKSLLVAEGSLSSRCYKRVELHLLVGGDPAVRNCPKGGRIFQYPLRRAGQRILPVQPE